MKLLKNEATKNRKMRFFVEFASRSYGLPSLLHDNRVYPDYLAPNKTANDFLSSPLFSLFEHLQ